MDTAIYFKGTKIVLENLNKNQGQICIEDDERGTYQFFWGAMGGTIQEFILRINDDYFANKLSGVRNTEVFNTKRTFKELRKYIREDLNLPWYKHTEFQKDLREKITNFQRKSEELNSEHYFVESFHFNVVTMPNFNLIDDRWERERIQNNLNISEPWMFIQTIESEETKWLKSIHLKIKKHLKK